MKDGFGTVLQEWEPKTGTWEDGTRPVPVMITWGVFLEQMYLLLVTKS